MAIYDSEIVPSTPKHSTKRLGCFRRRRRQTIRVHYEQTSTSWYPSIFLFKIGRI